MSSDQSQTWLVIGMGSMAYGKERRAVTALTHMPAIQPFFLTSQWEDGTVSDLLKAHNFPFRSTSIGYLGRARLRWTVLNCALMPKLFWTLLQTFIKQRAKGILILALQPFANVLPAIWLLQRLCKLRLVFYLGDIPNSSSTNRWVCRVMVRMADAIIVNSEAVRQGLVSCGVPKDSIAVVYNGVALERFTSACPLPLRRENNWSDSTLLVGYAGQFSEIKGIWDFVHAAELLLKCDDGFRFVLIGQADRTNKCVLAIDKYIRERQLYGKIVFTGWVSDMPRAYAALDVMVLPSRHEEAASNVVIEAQAAGVPIIATNTGGTPELIRDGHTGFLVERGQPGQIAEKLLPWVKDRSLLGRFARAARDHASEHFDARQNALKVQQITLGKPSRPPCTTT